MRARYRTIESLRGNGLENASPKGGLVDKIPGRRLVRKAEETGDKVEVPMAQNLGMVSLLKRLAKEIQDDHLAAFAGNLT